MGLRIGIMRLVVFLSGIGLRRRGGGREGGREGGMDGFKCSECDCRASV